MASPVMEESTAMCSEFDDCLQKIRQILSASFGIPIEEIEDTTLLFSSGLLDSFHLIELIGILEKTFGRKIRPGEISLENLDSPERIARLVGNP